MYDLRTWPLAPAASSAAGEGEQGSGGADASDESDDSDDLDDATPDSSSPADSEEGDETDGRRDKPHVHKLDQEAARYRTRAKAERDRADAAEARVRELETSLRNERVHNAFVQAAHGRVTDTDAAWKLADHTKISIGEDGKVNGVDDVIRAVVDRYPYLAPDLADGWADSRPHRRSQPAASPRDAALVRTPARRRSWSRSFLRRGIGDSSQPGNFTCSSMGTNNESALGQEVGSSSLPAPTSRRGRGVRALRRANPSRRRALGR